VPLEADSQRAHTSLVLWAGPAPGCVGDLRAILGVSAQAMAQHCLGGTPAAPGLIIRLRRYAAGRVSRAVTARLTRLSARIVVAVVTESARIRAILRRDGGGFWPTCSGQTWIPVSVAEDRCGGSRWLPDRVPLRALLRSTVLRPSLKPTYRFVRAARGVRSRAAESTTRVPAAAIDGHRHGRDVAEPGAAGVDFDASTEQVDGRLMPARPGRHEKPTRGERGSPSHAFAPRPLADSVNVARTCVASMRRSSLPMLAIG
jgi:hypothetical protein